MKSAPEFFELVRRQNGGVDTTGWAVLKHQPDDVLILGLDDPSVEIPRNRSLRLLVRVGTTSSQVLDRIEDSKEAQLVMDTNQWFPSGCASIKQGAFQRCIHK